MHIGVRTGYCIYAYLQVSVRRHARTRAHKYAPYLLHGCHCTAAIVTPSLAGLSETLHQSSEHISVCKTVTGMT
jgi:hypothetical protein